MSWPRAAVGIYYLKVDCISETTFFTARNIPVVDLMALLPPRMRPRELGTPSSKVKGCRGVGVMGVGDIVLGGEGLLS